MAKVRLKGEAKFDYAGQAAKKQLTFKKGDLITITQQYSNGWWAGELNGKIGYVPATYIKIIGDAAASARKPGPGGRPPARRSTGRTGRPPTGGRRPPARRTGGGARPPTGRRPPARRTGGSRPPVRRTGGSRPPVSARKPRPGPGRATSRSPSSARNHRPPPGGGSRPPTRGRPPTRRGGARGSPPTSGRPPARRGGARAIVTETVAPVGASFQTTTTTSVGRKPAVAPRSKAPPRTAPRTAPRSNAPSTGGVSKNDFDELDSLVANLQDNLKDLKTLM